MSKAFRKGDKVTYIADWDGKGTFYYVQATVHSCGAKQMVLTEDATGCQLGRNFAPVRATVEGQGHFQGWRGVHSRMTDEEAVAACLTLAERCLAHERNMLERLKAANPHDPRYRAAMDDRLAELHEPRALKH